MFVQNSTVAQLEFTANYLVIDIETCDAPIEEIEKQLDNWEPPANYKDPDKIESKRREAMDKIMERGALLDASPIICIAVKTDKRQIVFSAMGESEPILGWELYLHSNEADMLTDFRSLLNRITDISTTVVGHNVRGFDLPKLRNAYIRHRLQLPTLLSVAQRVEDSSQVVDTAQLFKAFSMQHRNDFCPSLSDMADSLGLVQPKTIISGADVPVMHRDGNFQEILTYCAIDTTVTEQAYLLMTGQSVELK